MREGMRGLFKARHTTGTYIAADFQHALKKREAKSIGQSEGEALDAKVGEHKKRNHAPPETAHEALEKRKHALTVVVVWCPKRER